MEAGIILLATLVAIPIISDIVSVNKPIRAPRKKYKHLQSTVKIENPLRRPNNK